MYLFDTLKKFGLNEKQARVYHACLELGVSPVSKIAKKAGVERTNAYYVLETLVLQGLVSKTIKTGKVAFTALHPKTIESVLHQQKAKMEAMHQEKEQELQEFLPQLSALYQSAGQKPKITFYEGREGIRTVLWHTLKKGVKEILFLWPAKDMAEVAGREEMERYIEERIRMKIPIRVIRIKSKEIPYKKSGHGSKFYRDLRFAPSYVDFSLTTMIYEDTVGVIFTKQEDFALQIESVEFAKMHSALFESLWKVSQSANAL